MATSKYITNIVPTVAPRLPAAPNQYDARFLEQYSNILRLYFNGIDTTFGGMLGDTQVVANSAGSQIVNKPGMIYLAAPNGQFHQDGVTALTANISNGSTTPIPVTSTTGFPSSGYILIGSEIIQYTATTSTTFAGTITRGALTTTAAAHTSGAVVSDVQGTGSGTTIGVVRFNATDLANGIAIGTDPTQIVFSYAGTYNLQVSFQILNYSNSADNITIWFRQNGNDVAYSASIGTVPANHASVPGATIICYNILLNVAANDYVQVPWTTDSGNSVVATYPAGTSPVHPVSPAVIFTATFVSRTPT